MPETRLLGTLLPARSRFQIRQQCPLSSLTLASNSGSQGSLNVGAAPGFAPTSPGTLTLTSTTDGEIFFGNGIGLVNFNHTSDNYLFAPSITGAGSGSLIFNRSDNVTFDLIYSKKAVTL